MNKKISEVLTAATLSVIRDQSLDESEMLEVVDSLLFMRKTATLAEKVANKDEAWELLDKLTGGDLIRKKKMSDSESG